jgi:putative membrane protein
MMWWDDGGWGAGGWILMSLMMVAFWGGLIALVVWLVQSVRSDSNPRQPAGFPTDRAEEVLAERFARGEIDEDEFQRRRGLLHPGSAVNGP